MSKEFDPMAWLDGQKSEQKAPKHAGEKKSVRTEESNPLKDTVEITQGEDTQVETSPKDQMPSVFHKINRESVNDFVKTNKDKPEVDLSELNEIDSAGLQGLLALHKHGVKLTNPKDDIKTKLDLVGANFII